MHAEESSHDKRVMMASQHRSTKPRVCALTIAAAAIDITGPRLVMATLAGVYPTVFNLLGAPWRALGVILASYLAVRALNRKAAPVTL
ncbi:Protein of unknown function [Propionibacterium freudenreichii]|nr:Protein of unknown function [Propionibacterium freudenreichii]